MSYIEPAPQQRYFDDSYSAREATRLVTPWLDVLRDVREHGAALLERSLRASSHDLADHTLLGGLFRQALVTFDGALTCLERFAVDAACIQLRALFEASVTLEWMGHADTPRRARLYAVGSLRQSRYWARRQIPGFDEHRDFTYATKDEHRDAPSEQTIEQARAWLASIEAQLAEPDLAAANEEFNSAPRGKRDWHAIGGATSLREMSKQIGREGHYLTYRRFLSYYVHGAFAGVQMRRIDGYLHIESLRNPEHFSTAFQFALLQMQHTLDVVYARYRPEERRRFWTRFRDEWKPLLDDPPVLEVQRYGTSL